MSYILDALQKSEQQRKNQNTPDLMTVHPTDHPSTIYKMPWVAITVSLIMLNLTGIGLWLFQNSNNTPTLATETATAFESSAPLVGMTTATDATKPREPTYAPEPSADPEQRITPADYTDLDSNRIIAPQRISELPDDIQRQIPDLVFSSHLYSDDFRLVNINGRMMRENEYIAPELRLVEITEDGVILDFREYRFTMSVLQDWAFD
jgi:general secretion pathway protein B